MKKTGLLAERLKNRDIRVREVKKQENGCSLIYLDYGRERYSAWTYRPDTREETYIGSSAGKPYSRFRKKAEKSIRRAKNHTFTPDPPYAG